MLALDVGLHLIKRLVGAKDIEPQTRILAS